MITAYSPFTPNYSE